MEVKVYEQNNVKHWSQLLKETFSNFRASLFLARQLAVRDIKAQYRQSYLGILWAFVNPVTTALVWIFLSGTGIIQLTDTGMPYPVYAFVGTLVWAVLSDSIVATMGTTNSSKGILTKINIPKESLVLLGCYKNLFNTVLKAVLLVVILVMYRIEFNWAMLLFPLVLFGVVLVGTTLGLFVTPIGLLYADVGRIISIGLKFIMYVTPVVYMIPQEGWTRDLMLLNPLTPLVEVSRAFITGQSPEFLVYYAVLVGLSVPLFFIALIIYRLSIPIILQH